MTAMSFVHGVFTGLFCLTAIAMFWWLTPDRISDWCRRWRNVRAFNRAHRASGLKIRRMKRGRW